MRAPVLLAFAATTATLYACGSGGDGTTGASTSGAAQTSSGAPGGRGSSGATGSTATSHTSPSGSATNSGSGTQNASGASAASETTSATGSSTTHGSSASGSTAATSSSHATSTTASSSSTTASSAVGPCDLYANGSTPCVAAHSTVRALYRAYDGNLYQVRRASDKTTKDIGVLSAGGFADAATQDAFCAGTTCTISVIYDQSPKANHLRSAPAGGAKNTPDNEANATALKLTVSGHSVYAVYIPTGVGYRIDATSGIATGDQPESEYMVTSGKHFNGGCCFDYGNAETNNHDDGNGTMEAIYFGNCTVWGKGTGTGPWVMADLENGLFAGGSLAANPSDTPLTSEYVTAMVKGKAGGFALKGSDATTGTLKTMYDGARPTPGYDPMKKQGAIILGIGGDNSNGAVGSFYEGVMTSGYPTDKTDDAVQANIVAAGYGR